MHLKVKKLYEDAVVPTRAYPFDSGLDLYAYLEEEIKLLPGERYCVPTGICVELPPPQKPNYLTRLLRSLLGLEKFLTVYEGQIRPKSGLANDYGLGIVNSPGTIDYGFTGELKAVVLNTSSNELIRIKPGQKIAQFVVCSVVILDVLVAEELSKTDRQSKGWGSSGLYKVAGAKQ